MTKAQREARNANQLELRFQPVLSRPVMLLWLLSHLGFLLLGAGSMSAFLDQPVARSALLLLLGAGCSIAGLILARSRAVPIRVGDLGVGLERGGEFLRIRWCDIGRISCEPRRILLHTSGEQQPLAIDLRQHGKAAAYIVEQAARRIPNKLELSPKQHDTLPEVEAADGESVRAIPLQVAGRRYDGSETIIALERDASRCARCAALYPSSGAPRICSHCEQALELVAV